MPKQKVILDCDVGHDDAIAIMVAAGNENIDLLGITCVAGNARLENTLPNTLNVCQYLGLDVPVYAGMSLPLVREQTIPDDVHGKSRLDGPVFEECTYKAQEEHAVSYIIRTLMESDGDICLVPVGPLTNIAMAMRLEPRIIPKIKRISLMGGAYGLGNSTPAAEFNIYADPEAAHIVFSSGVPINMMGLDLTNQVLATPAIIERMASIGNKAGKLFKDIMSFTLHSQAVNGLEAGPVHDVTAMVYLINPDLFEMKEMYVEIDLSKGLCYGRTVCDATGRTGKKPNALVGCNTKLEEFWDLVEDAIRKLN